MQTNPEYAAVEAVAADELAEHLGFNIELIPSVQREAIESEVAVVLKVADRFHQSALDALRGEVADRDAVIECKNIDIRERDRSLHEWAERAKAAERRVAELIEADKEYDLAAATVLVCTNKPAHILVTIIDYADAARSRFEAAKTRRAAALARIGATK